MKRIVNTLLVFFLTFTFSIGVSNTVQASKYRYVCTNKISNGGKTKTSSCEKILKDKYKKFEENEKIED
jgi:hypothetical protein